jgi:hypothetical protein
MEQPIIIKLLLLPAPPFENGRMEDQSSPPPLLAPAKGKIIISLYNTL